MNASGYIRWFKDIRLEDVPLVGGKTASLGELYSALSPQGVRVPNGFALTASAYRDALTQAGAWEELRSLLAGLDKRRIADLAKRAAKARAIVYAATDQEDLRREVSGSVSETRTAIRRAMSRSPCAVRPPPKICRPRASPGSTTVSSTFAARAISWMRAGAASPRSLPIVRYPIASITASIISRSRCRLR